MKFLRHLVFVASVLLFFSACDEKKEDETPILLTKVIFDGLFPYETEYVYNESYQLVKMIEQEDYNGVVYVDVFEYKYNGQGFLEEAHWPWYEGIDLYYTWHSDYFTREAPHFSEKIVFDTDSNGKILKMSSFSQQVDGSWVNNPDYYTYSWDDGNLVEEKYHNQKSGQDSKSLFNPFKANKHINKSARLDEMNWNGTSTYDNKKNPYKTLGIPDNVYYLNENNLLVEQDISSDGNELVFSYEYEYNESGYPVSHIEYKNGEENTRATYEYNK